MSIAGIVEAMRTRRPIGERLVWQCLENHANAARSWQMTDQAIAAELQLSLNTVRRAVARLVADEIIEVERFKRRPSVFRMKRVYAKPNGKTPPPHGHLSTQNRYPTPELSTQNEYPKGKTHTELGTQKEHSNTELGTQKEHTKTPPVRIHQKEKNTPTPHAAPVGDGKPPPRVCEPAGFAAFWAGYPRKTGKRAASQAFAAAIKRGNDPIDILDGLHNALPQLHRLETRYTPHPTTWLNQDRWHDEAPVDPVLRALGLTGDEPTNMFAGLMLQ